MVSFVNSNTSQYYPTLMELSQLSSKLHYVDSTLNSIFLRWEVEGGDSDLVYRIEVKDDTYIWITKYWGMKTECEIKGLGPETLYHFRLGVSLKPGGKEVHSGVLMTATKAGPPILFYLFKSAERGDVQGLHDFLDERKDSAALDAFDKKGETALIKGVKKGSKEIVTMLLSAGANVNQGAFGSHRTPLMYACYLGDADIAQVLIENGANVNSLDNNKCSPLHYAVDYSKHELVKLCLEFGSDINMKDVAGWSPLIRAVIFNSSEEVVEELLLQNADLCEKDNNGQTALSLAKLDPHQSHVNILLKYEKQLIEEKENLVDNKGRYNIEHNEEIEIEESEATIQFEATEACHTLEENHPLEEQ